MPEPTTQRRRYPRYRTASEVIVYRGSRAVTGRITNISRGGCLVYPPLTSGEAPEVRLSFRLSDDLPFINCKGEIIYSISDKGSGIAFTEISLYNQDLITQHFEKQPTAEKSEPASGAAG